EGIEALVDEDALRVEHRPHRAVAHQHALVERLEKWLHVSRRSVLNVSASISKYDLVTTSRPIDRMPWRIESLNSWWCPNRCSLGFIAASTSFSAVLPASIRRPAG